MKNKLNRRDFIKKSSLASVAIPLTLNGFPLFTREKPNDFKYNEDNENILVLIQLQGGNDGLNTLFDLNQFSNLHNVRSNIIIPESNLISLNNSYKFHPSLNGLKRVWEEENLGIIQNVGYPNQNRSHFRSTDIWNSASDADQYVSSGWIGRLFNSDNPDFPIGYPNPESPHPFALTLGKIVSETCQGSGSNFSLAINDPSNLETISSSITGDIPSNCYGDALSYVNQTVQQTNAYAEVISKAAEQGNNLATNYKETGLSQKLKNVAKLISGGLKTKVYVVQLGGFDTHNNQVSESDNTKGAHSDLLKELSDAIQSFQEDLKLLGIDKKVMGITYSEFGRRIRSNSGLGTDHGNAAPLFLFGSCVQNQILGDAPEIDTQVSINEGVQMQYDFRNIYSSILINWLGVTEDKTESILFNQFDSLPLFKNSCSSSLYNEEFTTNELFFKVYPNPTKDIIKINFKGNSSVIKITLYNSIGAVIKIIFNKKTYDKVYNLESNLNHLPKGTYFIHYQSHNFSKTKKVLKL